MNELVFIRGAEEKFPTYADALRSLGATPRFSMESADAAECDALLLPGGGDIDPQYYGQENTASHAPDAERDAAEWALIRRFAGERKPILGVCRGMQVLNVFFGGTLLQDIPGHSALPGGGDRIHLTAAPAGTLLARAYGERFAVNSAHHQAVGRLAGELELLQTAEDGVVEAFRHRELPVLGVEWHPERQMGRWARGEAVDGTFIYRYFLSLCGGKTV